MGEWTGGILQDEVERTVHGVEFGISLVDGGDRFSILNARFSIDLCVFCLFCSSYHGRISQQSFPVLAIDIRWLRLSNH